MNTQYPWDGHEALHPGQIPEQYNPIGEYQRSFTLPAGWENCFIRLEGADSAAAVWCNDQFVGYSEDSFTPAEFDLSATVRPGENTLTIQVYRFCSGSWLEDQDFWRMSGLFRPVKLFTKPVVHLEDIAVRQTFAPDFSQAVSPLTARSAARDRYPWSFTVRPRPPRWAPLPSTARGWYSAKERPTRTWNRMCSLSASALP